MSMNERVHRLLDDRRLELTELESRSLVVNLDGAEKAFAGKWLDPEIVEPLVASIVLKSLCHAGALQLAKRQFDVAGISFLKATAVIPWPTALFGAGLALGEAGYDDKAYEMFANTAHSMLARESMLTGRYGPKAIALLAAFDDTECFSVRDIHELGQVAVALARRMSPT